MITIGLRKGPPSRNQFIESFDRFGQPNDDGVLFIADDGTVMVGHLSGLEYDKENKDAFCFSGTFSGKFLRGYFHVKAQKGWIEADLNDLSTVQRIKMLLENGEKVRTKNHLLIIYNQLIDLDTAKSLAKNELVRLPKIDELEKILEEVDDEVFETLISRGYNVLEKSGKASLRKTDSEWVFLAEDSLNGATKHTMYGVARGIDGKLKSYAEIKIGDLPTLASAIFVLN